MGGEFYSKKGLARLGWLIYEDRCKRKLSLKEYAKLMQVSFGMISDLEIGDKPPSPRLLERFSVLLELELIDLVAIVCDQTPKKEEELNKFVRISLLMGDMTLEELQHFKLILDERIASATAHEDNKNFP